MPGKGFLGVVQQFHIVGESVKYQNFSARNTCWEGGGASFLPRQNNSLGPK